MSKSIDEQIVSMKLENGQFQKGVSTTLDALARLKNALSFKGAGKGLNDLDAAGKGVKLDHIAESVDTIKGKFENMSVAGIAALGALASKAVGWGLEMARNMFDPIQQGFSEYELKMGSIQTILANTQRHGTTLETVNQELDALNAYADDTIYNFAEMTRNVSLFTNAGIKVEDATSMIKGFSNAAAASGTSATGAAGAAYQLSQAMSAGTIRLMDWRSMTNVGMGGKNMQDGIIAVADAMGTFSNGAATAQTAGKDFNGSLEEMWLTADVMSNYLRIMGNEMSVAEMKALGLSNTQIDTLNAQAKTAEEAARKVRTFTQLMGTLAEANASGWTETAEIIIGDFNEATELFTAISDALGGIINDGATRRNEILGDWKKLGGRNDIIQGFKNIWEAFSSFVEPIAKAWANVFGVVSEGAEIFERPISRIAYVLKAVTQAFETFTEKLKMGELGMATITAIFTAVFSVVKALGSVISSALGLAIPIVMGIVKYFYQLGVILVPLALAIGNLAGGVAILIQRFMAWSGVSSIIERVFAELINARDNVLGPLIAAVAMVVDAFANLARFGNKEAFLKEMKAAVDSLDGPLNGLVTNIRNLLGNISKGADRVAEFARSFGTPVMDKAAVAIEAIAEAFDFLKRKLSGFSFDFEMPSLFKRDESKEAGKNMSALGAITAGLLSMIKALVGAISPIFNDLVEIVEISVRKIKEYFQDLSFTDAVALLNTGVLITLYLTIKKFFKNMEDLSGKFGEFLETFKGLGDRFKEVMDTARSAIKTWQTDIRVNMILKIAIALAILAAALWVLAGIDAKALQKGLFAMGAMFGMLVGTLKMFETLSFESPVKMLVAVGSLILLAIAVSILAGAVRKLSGMSWEELAKGLVGVAGLLVALAIFTKVAEAESGGIKSGIGLILLAVAIRLLATSVEKFGEMDVDTLKQGLLALTAVLVMLGVMSRVADGGNLIKTAAGIIILAAALTIMYFIIKLYAAMDVEMLAQGLIKMGAALALVALGMQAMPKDMLKNAASLVLVAGALLLLAGVIAIMGAMGWEQIAKGLVTLAGALLIIAVAMRVMGEGVKGAGALVIIVGALYILLPLLVMIGSLPWEVILLGLGALAGVFIILGLAGLLLAPVVPTIILLAVAIGLLGLAMMMAGAGMFLFTAGFALLVTAITAAVALGAVAFQTFLSLIPVFMQQVALGFIAFAHVISTAGPVIIGALTTVLMSLLQAIRNVMPLFFIVISELIMGMVRTLINLIPQIADAGLKMINRLLKVVADNIDPIIDTAADLIEKFIRGLERNTDRLVDAGVDLIVQFIESLTDSLQENEDRLNTAGKDLAAQIVRGMINGITSGIEGITTAARDVASAALNAAKRFLGVKSPSREFMKVGRYSSEGMAIGLRQYAGVVEKSATSVGMGAINAMKKTISNMPDLSKLPVDVEPRITPVLDLSSVEKGVRKLDPMLAGHKLSVDTSYAAAAVAERAYSRSTAVRQDDRDDEAGERKGGDTYTFVQTINSPKAVSAADTYRHTNNQLSQLRKAGK